MLRQRIFAILTGLITCLLSVAIVVAQSECEVFLEEALIAAETHCNAMGRNEACYGFNRVEASFLMEVADDFFNSPADVTPIDMLETIRTAPFSLEDDQWGVAVMVLQANLPETLPGQNVTFILMGDAEIENAVDPETAYDPVAGIPVTVVGANGAVVRSGPGTTFNTVGAVDTGTVFNADGLSEDGEWLRVIFNNRPAWVRRSSVDPTAQIDTLPVLTGDLQTPMQAFYLRTGIGQPTCSEVPDNSLLVQGPEDIQIAITVNGADIELGSSGILRVVETDGEPQLEVVVLDGEFVIKASETNPNDVVIGPGERTTLCLQDNNNAGLNDQPDDLLVTCAPSAPETVDVSEFVGDWCALEGVPASLLNYGLETCYENFHTVQAGENLFRIAQFYCVDLFELAALNGIADPANIIVGQRIILPLNACDGVGSTFPPAPPPPPPVTNPQPDAPVVSGCPIELVYPLTPVNSGNHTFQWTGVADPNATYRLQFFDYQGTAVQSFTTAETSYTLNLGQQTATGGEFSWNVDLLINGQFVCTSQRSPTLTRTGELNPPPPGVDMQVACDTSAGFSVKGTVTWSNLPASESITLVVDNGFANQSGTFTGSSGSGDVTLFNYPPATVTAVASTGEQVSVSC